MSKGARIKSDKAAAQAQAQQAKAEAEIEKQRENEAAPKYSAFTNPKNINWVILSGAMAALIITLMFMPQQLGAGITSVFSVMLWTGLFGLTLSRYIGKGGLAGFFCGSLVGMILHIFAPVLMAI